MQKDCRHCRDYLWDYVARELSDAETKKIQEHLQGCPSCREEAEQLKVLIPALREEIPLPASFSTELHKKLSQAAGEMATETPSRQKLPRWGGFKTLAPALTCLALVIGVFSSGLYDRWRNADQILTEPPVTSSVPVESTAPTTSSAPAPAVTNPVTPANPAPAETTPVAEAPTPASVEDTPSIASTDIDNPPVGYAAPRQYDRVTCLTLLHTQAFLDGWQTASGYEWKNYFVKTDPRELLPGVDADATVLQLSPEATESLLSFEEALNITQDGLSGEKTEFLIIITEDEE